MQTVHTFGESPVTWIDVVEPIEELGIGRQRPLQPQFDEAHRRAPPTMHRFEDHVYIVAFRLVEIDTYLGPTG